jgi:hypothetical protein
MEDADILFDLVKRLEEDEMRFITQFANCGRKRPEKALKLLGALRKMEKYDKRTVEAKFSNINITRYHLRQLIMRALRAYRDGHTVDRQIGSQIEDYRILYDKGLYDEAYRSLNKAQEMAKEHHSLGRQMEIAHLQKHRMLELETKDLPEMIQDRNAVMESVFAAFQVEQRMICDYHALFAAYRTEERPKTILPLPTIDEALLKSKDTPFITRWYGLMTASLVARIAGDLHLAKVYTQHVLDLWNEYPDIRDDHAANYKIALANYAVYLFPEGDYERVQGLLKEIASIPDGCFNEEAETFQNVANLRLLLALNATHLPVETQLVTAIEEGLTKYAVKINPARQFSIWYNLMLFHLIQGDFRAARVWIENILSHKKYQIRKEVQYITRLLELIIYYELEIWDTPDSAVTAVYRYFSRKDELTPFKREVLSHITKLSSTPLNERGPIFEKLYQKLSTNGEAKNAADILGLRVVKAWAKSKVADQTLQEVLQGI